MPTVRVNGAELHYTDTGTGAKTIVFAHGFLMSGRMFDDQINAFKHEHRCIVYDHRGQGQSEVTPTGYDLDSLTMDAVSLIENLHATPCHFVGLSMGGFVGMRIARHRPELLRSLVLMATSADAEAPFNGFRMRVLALARRLGLRRLTTARALHILFGPTFRADPRRAEEYEIWRRHIIAANTPGLLRTLNAIVTRKSFLDQLPAVSVPTLVLAGADDSANVPEKARRIHAAIPGSQFVIVPNAGHSPSIEASDAVNTILKEFFDSLQHELINHPSAGHLESPG
jgi:3-oxoadipate enol-lactonase